MCKTPTSTTTATGPTELDHDSREHALISYREAVYAIKHCLPEVHLFLEEREIRALVSRVVRASFVGLQEPSGSCDVWIRYRTTVLALARELREQDAETGSLSCQEVAEICLRLPLEQHRHPAGIRLVVVEELTSQTGLGATDLTRMILTGCLAEFLWSWRGSGQRAQRIVDRSEERDRLRNEIQFLDDIAWAHRDQAYVLENEVEIVNRDAPTGLRDTVAMLAFCMCRRDGHWPSWWRSADEDPDWRC
jgi:hypothetical protein